MKDTSDTSPTRHPSPSTPLTSPPPPQSCILRLMTFPKTCRIGFHEVTISSLYQRKSTIDTIQSKTQSDFTDFIVYLMEMATRGNRGQKIVSNLVAQIIRSTSRCWPSALTKLVILSSMNLLRSIANQYVLYIEAQNCVHLPVHFSAFKHP